MISLKGVTGGYDKQTAIVRNLTFSVEKGSFFALIGPNGSGKTTIIRLIMGALPLHSGDIFLDGKNISSYKAKGLAKKVAVMTQENEVGLDFTVQEIVNLGRYPHQSSLFFTENNSKDDEAIERAMKQTNVYSMRNQLFSSLSGGEKQRVLLAKALAQEPVVLLLDEPTNHLDVRHSIDLLDLLKELQVENNMTVLAILHDLNIASLYADQIGLLDSGQLRGTYSGMNKRDEQVFSSVYGVDMNFQAHPQVAKNQVFLLPEYVDKCDCSHEISVEYSCDNCTVYFSEPLRTISVGVDGKGITWEDTWHLQKKNDVKTAFENPLLVGDFMIYAYSISKQSVFTIKPEEIQQIYWDGLLLFSRLEEKSFVSIIVKGKMQDIDLMNAAMAISASKAELELKYQQPSKSLQLLTISSGADELLSEMEGASSVLQALFRYAWEHERMQSKVTKLSGKKLSAGH